MKMMMVDIQLLSRVVMVCSHASSELSFSHLLDLFVRPALRDRSNMRQFLRPRQLALQQYGEYTSQYTQLARLSPYMLGLRKFFLHRTHRIYRNRSCASLIHTTTPCASSDLTRDIASISIYILSSSCPVSVAGPLSSDFVLCIWRMALKVVHSSSSKP
jgi:hypothetical protein